MATIEELAQQKEEKLAQKETLEQEIQQINDELVSKHDEVDAQIGKDESDSGGVF